VACGYSPLIFGDEERLYLQSHATAGMLADWYNFSEKSSAYIFIRKFRDDLTFEKLLLLARKKTFIFRWILLEYLQTGRISQILPTKCALHSKFRDDLTFEKLLLLAWKKTSVCRRCVRILVF